MRALLACATLVAASAAAAAPAAGPAIPPAAISELTWRNVGPFRGGRVLAVAGVPGDPSTYYFGGVAGGVFKSTNAGATWTPVFDHEAIASIGAIAVAPSDPNVVYVGTGEACIRGNISYGAGVYKSLDAGRTWQFLGLRDTRHIGRVVVDPHDPNRVFVAALGHAFGPNAERGVFRSSDGGAHWQKVLFRDNDTGAIDLQIDPSNSSTLYAALWQVRRSPWNLSSGGPGSGLYKSTDGGTTWKRLSGGGLPPGIYGRIGIAVSPADPARVYASVEAADGGLYRSDDAGATWTRVNADERFRQRAWYFSHVFADPRSADTVYALNTGLFRSTDGGKTFDLLPVSHGDNHGLWIDPRDPRRMIAGNDGGATLTIDGGKTWSEQSNQPTAQFYHVITDDQFPYRIYGTQQDNSGVAIKSYGDDGTITMRDWYEVGGETGWMAPDPRDPEIVFSDNEHSIYRYDHRADSYQDISVAPEDMSGRSAAEQRHRFQWTTPLIAPSSEPGVLYVGGEAVWRSTDDGATWTAISSDLTRDDKSKQKPSGGPIQLDITSVEYYDTVFVLAASPLQRALWAGTDDGLVWVTRDTGAHWRKVTPPGMPEWGTVSMIDPSPHAANGAYLAVDRHRLDDFRPYAWRTRDLGATWTSIAAGLPDGAYVHAVREDPVRAGLLYAATELGVFVSIDDGARWQPLQNNLPHAPVNDLVVHGDDLVIATNGRGFWVLDDIAPLRELAAHPELARAAAHLFAPERAVRLYYNVFPDKRRPVGENPPQGAVLDYWLASEPRGDVTIEIVNSAGAVVRRLTSAPPSRGPDQPPEWIDVVRTPDQLPKKAGANRFVWDLRWSEPTQIPGAFYQGLPPWGPLALPGRYTVKLTVAGKPETATLELVNDPRSKASDADLRASFDLQQKTRAVIDQLHVTVNQIRSTRAQLTALRAHASRDLATTIDALLAKMAPIEAELIQVKLGSTEGMLRFPAMLNEQLDTFRGVIEADRPPTRAQAELEAGYARRVDAQAQAWKHVVATDVPALNQKIVASHTAIIDPEH
ncbi:MAG TPA: hypothetical protein VLX92_22000 [Kofleriaceae bacterium]|nr:hypothetical protein [Kofleriaceae bacterium]